MEEIKILIGGDLVINKEGYTEEKIDADIKKLFASSDLNILNLECPVTDAGDENKILKTGPHLRGNSSSIKNVLSHLNTSLVTLANNHLLDFGTQGVEDTLQFCEKNGIEVVGGGRNVAEARKPFRTTVKGKKISIVNFAENEWANASGDSAGANPMDTIDNAKQIQEETQVSDFVIVIIHGGHEYYNLPSPRMQKQYRFYVDMGADLIVGHHPHCISGYEFYKGVPIYYSLGNFLFTKDSKFSDWYKGLILELSIVDGKLATKTYAVQQESNNFSLNLVEGELRNEIHSTIEKLHSKIIDGEALQEEWNSYSISKSKYYLTNLSPISFFSYRLLRLILIKFNFIYFIKLNKPAYALILNLIRCEAHRDISINILAKHVKQ